MGHPMTARDTSPLRGPDLRDMGIDAPWDFGIADQVRFSELDILNHVNNAAYVTWFENARIAFFMGTGVSDYSAGDRPTLVLRNMEVDFRQPLFLGDAYVVTARNAKVGRTSWVMEQAVFKGAELAVSASCVIVNVSRDGSRAEPLTPDLIAAIESC